MGFRDQLQTAIDYQGESLTIRKVGAMEWVEVAEVPEGPGKAVRMSCKLLAMCVLSPSLSEDEWKQVPVADVIALGEIVMEHSGMLPKAKKNSSTANGSGSSSGSASDLVSSTPAG